MGGFRTLGGTSSGEVIPAGASIGDILFWDGSAWVANAQGEPDPTDLLQWDGAVWQPISITLLVQSVTGGAGVLIANGLGTAQTVVLATIAGTDTVIWTRQINAGAPGLPPLTVITPAASFDATFSVGDTSQYTWKVIR